MFLGILLTVTLMPIFTRGINVGWLFYVQASIILFILVAIFIQYKLRIVEESLTYQILFLNIRLYNRTVKPKEIIRINFNRVGAAKKQALIQMKKGLDIRITNFKPKKVYVDLSQFASKNKISVSKTKEYQEIEKM
jgi:hypothetical protein